MLIFGEVGLSNQGRIAEKSDQKVCVLFNHLNFSTFSLLVTGFRVQRLTANTIVESPKAFSWSMFRVES
jgi:hypothetical protein